jgi:hypothetical protein
VSQSAVWDDDVDAGKGSDFRQIVDRGRSLENRAPNVKSCTYVHTYEDRPSRKAASCIPYSLHDT